MGRMYVYRCDSCGEERHLMPGAGMMFPSVCQEVMEGIAAGEYGPELKEAYEASPLPGVCAEKALYVCRACGRWALMPDATLYEPLDVDEALDEQYGEKTVREWGHIPYLMTYQLKKYRVICSFRPTCECGSKMRKARLNEGTTLACPSCGTPNGVVEFAGFWD